MRAFLREHVAHLIAVADGMFVRSVNLAKPFPFVPGFVGKLTLQPEIASETSLI